jgi:phosphohistidine swiveling domain-containing protein
MGTVHFSIEGEYLTEISRQRVIEGRWDHAFKILFEGLEGISESQVFSILRGDSKLIGANDVDLVEDDDTKHKKALHYAYGGCYVTSEGRYMRPYAVVTSWGPDDYDFKMGRTSAGSDVVYRKSIGSRDPKNYASRSLFYANDPSRDLLRHVPLPKDYVGLRESVFFSEYDVLFEDVINFPAMLVPYAPVNDAAGAMIDFLSTGRRLSERGHSQEYRDQIGERPTTPKNMLLEKIDDQQAEAIVAVPAQRFSEQIEVYRKEILEQAGDDFIEMTYEDDGEKTLRIPRAPFEHWALESQHRQNGYTFAAPWNVVCPSGLKMMNDDPYHSDWVIGAGLEPSDWTFMGKDPMQEAALELKFKVQHEKLKFQALVLSGIGSAYGTVVHIEPGKTFEGRGKIGIIRNAGPEYVFAAQEAVENGYALITEQGGSLAHLVSVFRDTPLMLVRVKDARKLYKDGQAMTVNCREGTVTLHQHTASNDF